MKTDYNEHPNDDFEPMVKDISFTGEKTSVSPAISHSFRDQSSIARNCDDGYVMSGRDVWWRSRVDGGRTKVGNPL
ncbi:hypothetical protein V6N12_056879 [Hibiscus sabdariffa]|uniref:Uncharacterized protein n=1 Tax=Hibiscus sabdariffa TaxID=183260 RepID=A0ABR2DD93_9ROSI